MCPGNINCGSRTFSTTSVRMVNSSRGGGGEGWVPSNRVMGICGSMASHLHDMNDYNGVAFLQ